MIIAIEGASACGKTTWCRSHFPRQSVLQPVDTIAAPDLFADPALVAEFWVNHNIASWQRAVALEREHGIAFCDTDPFHLYYSWALWKAGVLDGRLFAIERSLYRQALAQRRIGLADHVLWREVPDDELRRRAQADTTRRRKRHEIYLALVPGMKLWFRERERVLPGSVHALTNDLRVEQLPDRRGARYTGAACLLSSSTLQRDGFS